MVTQGGDFGSKFPAIVGLFWRLLCLNVFFDVICGPGGNGLEIPHQARCLTWITGLENFNFSVNSSVSL